MKCTKCKNSIPERRAKFGYKECINCSTVEAYGCVDVIYHKTGNTLEITDSETSRRINKLARRSGFGVMRGIVTSKNKSAGFSVPISNSEPIIESFDVFNDVGMCSVNELEKKGITSAYDIINAAYKNRQLSLCQVNNLREIIKKLHSDNLQKTNQRIN